MSNNKRIVKYYLTPGLILVVITVSLLFAKNLKLKQTAGKSKWITPILNNRETEKIIVKNNPGVEIIHTGKKGIWDKQGIKKVALKHELSIKYIEGDTNTIFYNVTEVKGDRDGNIYVSEFRDGRIRKFDRHGNYLSTIGRSGKGPGEFLGYLKIFFDKKGILNVVDWGLSRVSFFTSAGEFINSFNLSKTFGSTGLQGFISDNNGSFYISYYDRETDKTIHKFDDKGNYITSFGVPGIIKQPMKYIDFTIKAGISRGEMYLTDNRIIYSQWNPYIIYIYNIDGNLEKVIFRENSFMLPDKYQIRKHRIQLRVPAFSGALSIWHNMIVNCVYVPSYLSKNVGCVVDLFTLDGRLLTSLQIENHIAFSHLNESGKLYGSEIIGEYEDEQIVVYSLKTL